MTKKILISLNTAWNLLNFRAGLIGGLISSGFEVVAVAPKDEYVVKLELLGCLYTYDRNSFYDILNSNQHN